MIVHKALIINGADTSFPKAGLSHFLLCKLWFLTLLIYLFVFLVKLHELLMDNNLVSFTFCCTYFSQLVVLTFNEAYIIFQVKGISTFYVVRSLIL